ncbi:hypothetical protein ALDI51_21430 [Alicycliphilus denitrificans]|nr:hypothetical protein ALDI51_21430 [Alicycliphilus denitrificans]
MGQAGALFDRQCVHVCTQAQALGPVAAPQLANEAGLPDTAFDLKAPGLEPFSHEIAGAVFCKAQFRVMVDVTPYGHQVGSEALHCIQIVLRIGWHGYGG